MRRTKPLAACLLATACESTALDAAVWDPDGPSAADGPQADDEDSTAGDEDSDGSAADDGDAPAVTYHRDVAPILASRCTSCHVDGGIAPFALDRYEDAAAWAPAIASTVAQGSMPPMPASLLGCRPIEDARIMADADRDTLAAWDAAGAAQGDPDDAPPPPDAPDTLGTPSLVIDSALDYEPLSDDTDEYRCFFVEAPLASAMDIVATSVESTNPAIVHHAFIDAVPPQLVDEVAARDAADPGPGWACFGGTGVAGTKRIGGVVPGSTPRAFPAGTGVQLDAGTRFIVLMHYNYVNNRDPNRFAIQLWASDGPLAGAPARARAVEASFVLPAGDPDIVAIADTRIVPATQQPGTGEARAGLAWEAGAHMHMLGVAARLELVRPDGSVECLLDIDRWDFEWQGDYAFVDPLELHAGDTLRLTCRWDNSAENQPIVDGVQQSPREVRWGESSLDEMCLGGLTTTPMP